MKIGILMALDTENTQKPIDCVADMFPKSIIISDFVDNHTTETILDFIKSNGLKLLFIDENFDHLDYDKIYQSSANVFKVCRVRRKRRGVQKGVR